MYSSSLRLAPRKLPTASLTASGLTPWQRHIAAAATLFSTLRAPRVPTLMSFISPCGVTRS